MRSRLIAPAAALVVATLLAGPTLAAEALAGSGKLETRTLDLAAFTKIDLGGAFTARIAFGKTQRVDVTVDDNLWDNLQAAVDEGRLALDWARHCQPSAGCAVTITMAAPLEEFTLAGAGDVGITGLAGRHLTFYLRGAGNAVLDGTVDGLEIVLTGAGSCAARGLKAKDVTIILAGMGDCEVHASASLDARISGVGNVTYWGEPGKKQTEVTGKGEIIGR